MRTVLLLLLTACLASASPGGDTLTPALREQEQRLVKAEEAMKEQYRHGLCNWLDTTSATMQLLEFRRDHAASLKEQIVFQKQIISVREEVLRVYRETEHGSLKECRARGEWLVSKRCLLEMESRGAEERH